MTWKGIIDTYNQFLPLVAPDAIVTLNEGNTPLIPAIRLGNRLKLQLYFKFEGAHPTGSFKDRGMTMAVSKAKEAGAKTVICASTGNTASSAAAYAARGGLRSVVLIPEGKVALGKLTQSLMYGAEVVSIEGNFDAALKIVRELTEKHREIAMVNSINPYRIEGQKSGAFEICDQLGDAPDYLAIPVGNAGNITAYWKGFKEYHSAGRSEKLPKMIGFQAAGAAPIVLGKVVEKPETIATAIRIGNPASWTGAVNAMQESRGHIDAVTDDEILAAYKLLAREEGLFVEPASAASLAGVLKDSQRGYFPPWSTVVCIFTGNGLKDPDTALKVSNGPTVLPADFRAVEEFVLR